MFIDIVRIIDFVWGIYRISHSDNKKRSFDDIFLGSPIKPLQQTSNGR